MSYLIFQVLINETWVDKSKVQLTQPYYRIGRHPSCELSLIWWKGLTLSKVQASLYELMPTSHTEAGYKIQDGEIGHPSTNGTRLNGRSLIGKVRLFHNDVITLAPGLRMFYGNDEERIRESDKAKKTLDTNPTLMNPVT